MYDAQYSEQMNWDEFIEANLLVCKQLMKIHGAPARSGGKVFDIAGWNR
jgi:hypothetical protein